MYCDKCGREVPGNAVFCDSCGKGMGVGEEEGTSGHAFNHLSLENSANPGVPVSMTRSGSGKKKIIIGTLLAILLVVGGSLGWQKLGAESRVQDKLDLAVKYLSENDYEKAILAFNDAIKIDPKEVKAYQGLARVYTIKGDYDNAKSTYDKGLTSVAQEKKSTLQLGLGGMYIDQGQLEKAEQAFQELNSSNKGCLEGYWGLAMVYQQKGDNAKAEAILRKAIENNPNEFRGYNTLALFLKQNGKSADALSNLMKSISLEMNQEEAYLVLSDIYKGRWNDLQSKLTSVSDQQLAAMLQLYSYYASGDNQKAVDIYKEKLVQQNKNKKARVLAAIAMARLGDNTGAEAIITQLTKEQLNEWLLSDVASYYQAIKNNDKAKEYAIKALQANPTNLDTIALLQRLNASDADTKIYAAHALLFNWKPVAKVKEELQTAGQPVQTAMAEKKEEIKLTPDYWIPDISKMYLWDGKREFRWRKTADGKYWINDYYVGAESFDQAYEVKDGTVYWTKIEEAGSKFAVGIGSRRVLVPVSPGGTWSNTYTIKDEYAKSEPGERVYYKESYTFVGMEEISVLGKPTPAAHVHLSGTDEFNGHTPKEEDLWLVKNMGLVKKVWDSGGKTYTEQLSGIVPR
ncbi:MAG: tetratricopeptide repeat protein [Syntrophomonadaceae bacterium]